MLLAKLPAKRGKNRKKAVISISRLWGEPYVEQRETDAELMNRSQAYFVISSDSLREENVFFSSRETSSRDNNKSVARKTGISECTG